MDKDEVTYDEVTEWTKSVGREELVQIITDIANKYYLPRTLVRDVKNTKYTNPDMEVDNVDDDRTA